MFTALLRRPAHRAAANASRTEVCPPSGAMGSRWARLASRLRADHADDDLAPVRQEFCDAVADLPGAYAQDLAMRMRHARTLQELWHLRAELFNVVSLQHNQGEAGRRVARLNRHFPCRTARSGFVALASPAP